MKRDQRPYSRSEIARGVSKWPERGLYCARCETVIPQFEEINEDLARKLHNLESKLETISKLRELTGCDLRWAKIWALHPDGPETEKRPCKGPPCPHCGESLPSELSRQCLKCHTDWHDPDSLLIDGKPA